MPTIFSKKPSQAITPPHSFNHYIYDFHTSFSCLLVEKWLLPARLYDRCKFCRETGGGDSDKVRGTNGGRGDGAVAAPACLFYIIELIMKIVLLYSTNIFCFFFGLNCICEWRRIIICEHFFSLLFAQEIYDSIVVYFVFEYRPIVCSIPQIFILCL